MLQVLDFAPAAGVNNWPRPLWLKKFDVALTEWESEKVSEGDRERERERGRERMRGRESTRQRGAAVAYLDCWKWFAWLKCRWACWKWVTNHCWPFCRKKNPQLCAAIAGINNVSRYYITRTGIPRSAGPLCTQTAYICCDLWPCPLTPHTSAGHNDAPVAAMH